MYQGFGTLCKLRSSFFEKKLNEEVSHKGHSSRLTSSSASLSRKSIDARITKVLEKRRQDGGNSTSHPGDILDLRVAALPPECSVPRIKYGVRKSVEMVSDGDYTRAKATPVVVTRTKPQYLEDVVNSVQLTPTQNSKVCNKSEFFVHSGVY